MIDCVDIYKQPAFDDPALSNHTIQMKPGYISGEYIEDDKNKSTTRMALQIWQRTGNCPNGSVPILRVRKQDLLRFNNLEFFRRKYRKFPNGSDKRQTHSSHTLVINKTTVSLGFQPNHSFALLVATVTHFVGSKGSLNAWNPRVASPNEYTTSQIWLFAGGSHDYESVESGKSKVMVIHRRDSSYVGLVMGPRRQAALIDLLCSGFVQTSQEVTLGTAISPLSSESGT